jgi:hypothetical protein
MGALLAAITTEHGASVHPELSASFLAAGLDRIAQPASSRALSDETGEIPRDLDAQDLGANAKVEGPA